MESRGFDKALEQWGSALRAAAGRVAFRALPGLVSAVLELDAARFRDFEIPRLFSPHLREIDPRLNDDLLDLYGASEQALAHRFSFLNRACESGAEIDWQHGESPAWLDELHAFDYARDLALTYRISGEERYTRHLQRLIAQWISANPLLKGPGWRPEPLARRVRNWILAADLARAAWAEDAGLLEILGQSLALQCAEMIRQTGSTRGAPASLDQVRALLLAARSFRGSVELRAAALDGLRHELERRLEPSDGAYSTSPARELSFAAAALEFLVFDGERSEASLIKEGLREILQTLEGILHPDGSLPLFGPPPRDDFWDAAALAAVFFHDPTWKTLAGKFGIWPYMLLGEDGRAEFRRLPDVHWQPANSLLPGPGFYRLSGADSSALVISAPSGAAREGRSEESTLELSIQGHRVIADSGEYAPSDHPEKKDYLISVARNIFLVGGAPPLAKHWRRENIGPATSESGAGFIGIRWPARGLAECGYERAWYCLDGRGWVILDRLEDRGGPPGTSLLHFYPTFEIELLREQAVARSRALAVTVIPFGSTPAWMTVSRGDDAEFPGWYTPAAGVRYPASVLAIRWTELKLPWVGGAIIVPEADRDACAGAPDVETGRIAIRLWGREYRLPA